MNNKKTWIVLILLFFLAGVSGSYFLFRTFLRQEKSAVAQGLPDEAAGQEDLFDLRMFYPVEGRIETIEKKLPRRTKQNTIAEAVVEEYFMGPENGKASPIPQNVRLLGIYRGFDRILYVDLSDEVRRNFQGDAASEFLVLKGLYESLTANLQDVQDVKVLVEGREIETLGGHFYLNGPIRNTVSYDARKTDVRIPDEQ
jgi:spore germination protein GerM